MNGQPFNFKVGRTELNAHLAYNGTEGDTGMVTNEPMSLGEFLTRAILWGLAGYAVDLRGSKLRSCAFLGPIGEKVLGFKLEDILMAMQQERRKRERQQKRGQISAALQSLKLESITVTQPVEPLSTLGPSRPELATSLTQTPEIEKDSKWREVIVHPSIVLVLGKRGSGKSALGYRLLELFSCRLSPYVLGLPKQAQKHLPEWIGMVQTIDEVPEKSIVLVDEAYLTYHSRESLKSASRQMSRMLNLSRQRDQTLIFVTPEARQVDKNIVSSANVVVFKDLGMLQLKFDRPELNKLATEARQALGTVRGDKRRWSYVYSPDADFSGLLDSSLPTFWGNKLSHIFAAGGETSATRLPKRMSLQERVQKAKELSECGLSFRQIGKMLGVTKSTAYNYVKSYPYKS